MKRIATQLILLAGVISMQIACTKKSDLERLGIDDANLTTCPANSDCEYLFTENADIEGAVPTFKSGNYRMFWAGITEPGMDSRLYIKAPMTGNSFYLDKSSIAGGSVVLYRSCAACLMFPLRPIADGYVKGINLTPGRPADQTKWLVEARVILEDSSGGSTFKDTLYVKQYFYPNFVYN